MKRFRRLTTLIELCTAQCRDQKQQETNKHQFEPKDSRSQLSTRCTMNTERDKQI